MRLDAIPESVKKTLETLENNGFEAYLVGGCVRDIIMNRAVHDYDITTNALPGEIIAAFPDNGKVTDGIRHGTVGIIWGKAVNEITTYRVDGTYSDARHPDGVFFTKSLKEDLWRRDFTVNAIACDLSGNILTRAAAREILKISSFAQWATPEKGSRRTRFASCARFGFRRFWVLK